MGRTRTIIINNNSNRNCHHHRSGGGGNNWATGLSCFMGGFNFGASLGSYFGNLFGSRQQSYYQPMSYNSSCGCFGGGTGYGNYTSYNSTNNWSNYASSLESRMASMQKELDAANAALKGKTSTSEITTDSPCEKAAKAITEAEKAHGDGFGYTFDGENIKYYYDKDGIKLENTDLNKLIEEVNASKSGKGDNEGEAELTAEQKAKNLLASEAGEGYTYDPERNVFIYRGNGFAFESEDLDELKKAVDVELAKLNNPNAEALKKVGYDEAAVKEKTLPDGSKSFTYVDKDNNIYSANSKEELEALVIAGIQEFDYSKIDENIKMNCHDNSGDTQDIGTEIGNITRGADASKPLEEFTLTDKQINKNGNVYKYEFTGSYYNGKPIYECVSKNGEEISKGNLYVLEDVDKLIQHKGFEGYGKNIGEA
ncbi:MAG: hypothetical protein R3Y28_05870 [Candidatus Gastranaerophilales bacterium]